MEHPLTFQTWNLYLGADIAPLFTASPNQIPQRVTEVFRQFLATNFPERAKALAHEIADNKPVIVGLQEVVEVQLVISDFGTVTYDFEELLLDELNNKGLHYVVAARNSNFSVALPDSYRNSVQLQDRDCILIRKDADLNVIHKEQQSFQTNLVLEIGVQPFEVVRGWSSIDLRWDKRLIRVINTHLESLAEGIQTAQAMEILNGPANTELPVIVMGDLNSNADGSSTPTYGLFIGSGFQDAWAQAGEGSGATCCQDADLLNNQSLLIERIDFILFKNGWKAVKADVVGDKQKDRTKAGLWPSDHASITAELRLNKKC